MNVADILWAFGAYLDRNSGATKTYAHTLKVLYDEDWTEEKGILSYYDEEDGSSHPGFDAAKQAATPFLKWLRTADSDDDEDSDGALSAAVGKAKPKPRGGAAPVST